MSRMLIVLVAGFVVFIGITLGLSSCCHTREYYSLRSIEETNRHAERMAALEKGLVSVVFYNTPTGEATGSDPVTITASFGTICLKGGEFRELMLSPGKYRTQIRYASYPQFSGSYDFEVVGLVPSIRTAPDGAQFNCVALGWL